MSLSFIKQDISTRFRTSMMVIGIILVSVSLLISNRMAQTLREKEKHDVELWAAAMERVNRDALGDYMKDPLVTAIINNRNNIPFIITDENLIPISCHLIEEHITSNPLALRKKIDEMAAVNTPIIVHFWWTTEHNHIIFYGRSLTLKMLYVFPLVQMLIIIAFVVALFVAFRSTKQDEQKRVWIGLAKETAHQLGTPTSSLMGWLEYLKEQPIDQAVVDEISKDVSHLRKIVDRFSKIGSDAPLILGNINEIVGGSVMYFRKRIPRYVNLTYDGLAQTPIYAMVNIALFEWVIENLLKNSLDAMQGRGSLDVLLSSNEHSIFVDVRDSGKGIAKSNWKRIFKPGYSTKTRGWGLGLSLSRRIVEEYHGGHIAVIDSQIGVGTTIRVTLKRAYSSQ
ncbi:MAG: HAMP domain-containing histidine kinase [Alistipes sp.]|nr:HAMP domain-containing histidine kinase [Candidatus Alistipes equi]